MSQVATCRDKRQVIPIPYAPGGCPVKLGEEKCGETQGLDIIQDFHQLYQEKMSQIDVSAGGDSLQEKVDLQQKWIDDLTEQNRMLARVIEELETEAIGRLQQLENKLKNAAKSFSEEDVEALAERDRKIKELEEALNSQTSTENNVENESDRKSREDAKQRIGTDKQKEETKFVNKDLPTTADYSGGRQDEDQIKEEIKKIREQSSKDMPPGDEGLYKDETQKQGTTEGSTGTDRGKAEEYSDEKRKYGGQSKYPADDKKKTEEDYAIKQKMDKMHTIINEELATKQEIICLLKGEIFKLEDKIIESQKEASLKDDLIKELRKELKKMRNKLLNGNREKESTGFEPRIPDSPSSITSEQEFITINNSKNHKDSNNSTLIFLRKDLMENVDICKGSIESSDSSECGLNDCMAIKNRRLMLSCSSDNNIKGTSRWMRPMKERSKLTKINRRGDVERSELDCNEQENCRKLSIPKHVPVKTHVNNIEYNKHLS